MLGKLPRFLRGAKKMGGGFVLFRCLRIFASKSELTSRAKIQLLELKCKYFVQIFQWNTQKNITCLTIRFLEA